MGSCIHRLLNACYFFGSHTLLLKCISCHTLNLQFFMFVASLEPEIQSTIFCPPHYNVFGANESLRVACYVLNMFHQQTEIA